MFRWPTLPDPSAPKFTDDRVSLFTRRALFMQGVKYYEGRPDKFGHTLRYASNGRCVECSRVAMKVQRTKRKEANA